MVTEYFMTNDLRTELKTMLWTTSKHISITTGQRVPHPKEVMDYLGATCVPNSIFRACSSMTAFTRSNTELAAGANV
jgi:acyl-CoA thioester hydrolase